MSTDLAPESGLVTVASAHGAAETVERLEAALRQKGGHLFPRIDHADGARQAGLSLRPTVVLPFGNPQVGTALMQANQTAGLDLPLKALVWEDGAGKARLTYNDPAYLARRHGVGGRGGDGPGHDGGAAVAGAGRDRTVTAKDSLPRQRA